MSRRMKGFLLIDWRICLRAATESQQGHLAKAISRVDRTVIYYWPFNALYPLSPGSTTFTFKRDVHAFRHTPPISSIETIAFRLAHIHFYPSPTSHTCAPASYSSPLPFP